MTTRQLVMAGAPGTGKTSFLALLWIALSKHQSSSMKLAHYQDDRDYLNLIAGRLLRCESARHTEIGEDRDLALSLLLGASETAATLRVPDLSGETWLEATTERHWPVRVERIVSEATGLLLFLHARHLDAGATRGQVEELTRHLGAAPESDATETVGAATDAAGAATARKEAAKHAPPTQVALVDVLQLIAEQRGGRPYPVGLVVSAWDLEPSGLTPDGFVARNLPLVSQYVSSNDEWLRLRTFGLSAQGGSFGAETDRKELAARSPLERAMILSGDGEELVVTDIAEWALAMNLA